jgi:endonuclease/exonuclease/phosphatase family metal-dependent hydrolase
MKKIDPAPYGVLRFPVGEPSRVGTIVIIVLFLCAILLGACSRKQFHEEGMRETAGPDAAVAPAATIIGVDAMWVMAPDMATDLVKVYTPAVADWNSASALQFNWKPTTALGYTSAEVGAWGDPMDMKVRYVRAFGNMQCAAVVGGGLATICTFTGGQKKWARNVGGYPHGAEILPNGNIAIAAYHGNWIRVYASSQGATNGTYAQFNLNRARGVLWDPTNNVLWAIGQIPGGDFVITALTVGGSAASPTLTEVTARRSTIPGNIKGVDFSAYYGDYNKLWLTTDEACYIFNKSAKTFTPVPGAANRTVVNGISNQPFGQIIQTKVDTGCTFNGWCTNKIDFYTMDGALQETKVINGAAISKAKVISPNYQMRAEYGIATYNIRRITTADQGNRAWTVRRPYVVQMVEKYDFDIFGVQEPLGQQIDHLVTDLPRYARFGVSDHNDHAYQHQDIYYKTARFSLLSSGKFWMAPGGPTSLPSDVTPWDSYYHACVCTWGKFQDKSTGKQFFVFNTHYDPGAPNSGTPTGATARLESSKVVLSKIQTLAGTSPVIFMGDLNANQNTEPYAYLKNSDLLEESWDLAAVKYPASRQTGNWWNTNPAGNSQIDHIFVTSHWTVAKRGVLWDNFNGILPSDHFPVLAEMKLN